VSSHFSEKIADYFQCPRVEDEENDLNEEQFYKRYETKLKRDVITHTAGAIISSPFHVISIRMMAQFVGKETKYNTIVGSIVQIYNEEGILGFFSGLIPRLIFDLSCVVIASTATYLIGRHFIKDKEARVYISPFTSFVCSSVFYPMNVVSTHMIINGAG
jgi:mitochondrial carrier